MSVYKKKRRDGTVAWFYDFTYNNVRYRGVGGSTKTLAQRSLDKIRDKVISGQYEIVSKPNNPRFEDMKEKFLLRRKHMRSWMRDDLSMRNLLKKFKGKTLVEIKPQDIEDYIQYRILQGVANATVNRELSCFKRMYSLAIKWGDARRNPVCEVQFLEEPPGRSRFLSAEEAKKLIEVASDHFKPILITALNTGMRHGEIVNLKWSQVHIDHVIDPYIQLDHTKNNKKRFVPLNETMINLLNNLRSESKHETYVFPGKYGNKLIRTTKPFKNSLKNAKIKNLRFHDLRHTFASHFIMSGGDLLTLKEILGHSTMRMVERYAHLASAHKRKQVNNLNSVFGEPSKDSNIASNSAVN